MTFTLAEVETALNRAADDVSDTLDGDGSTAQVGRRDLINLAVSVTLSYLRGTATTVEQAIIDNYPHEDGETTDALIERVLGWCDN